MDSERTLNGQPNLTASLMDICAKAFIQIEAKARAYPSISCADHQKSLQKQEIQISLTIVRTGRDILRCPHQLPKQRQFIRQKKGPKSIVVCRHIFDRASLSPE